MKDKKPPITKKELQAILADYEPNASDDDTMILYKEAINNLDAADKIMFVLYADLASEQKVADMFNVSRTPIHSLIKRCRQEITDYIKTHTNDN